MERRDQMSETQIGRADSLPYEVRSRMAERNALLRRVLGSSRGIRESQTVMGIPTRVNMHSGQSCAVTANTLAMPYAPPLANGPSMGPGPGAIDYGAGGRMGYDRLRFMEFCRRMGVPSPPGEQQIVEHFARTPITESKWPGPMVGGPPTAQGTYLNDDFDRVGGRIGTRFKYGPRPGSPKRDWRTRDNNTIMPTIRGDDDSEEEEDRGVKIRSEDEEEAFRVHRGLTCAQAHGICPHSAWDEHVSGAR